MSKQNLINKLSVTNIRTFRSATIQFDSLTLILGPNCTGKSTLIEAIRYGVGIGDGRSLVSGFRTCDACYMAGNTTKTRSRAKRVKNIKNNVENCQCLKDTIRSQIKLKMLNNYVVSRALTSTQKGSRVEVRNTENVVGELVDLRKNGLQNNAGKNQNLKTLTVKSTDLDAHLQNLHQISPPLLHHVSLCTQEDTFWPVNDLKKRLEEIFNAQCYTKLIDSLKNIKKNVINEYKINNLKLNEKNKEVIRIRGVKTNILNENESIRSEESKILKIDREISEKTENNKKFNAILR